ncbi:MAG: 2-oxo-4-hydroxy-4-carboxy-5-ureidoimidazoline decarboxylase [Acidobacteriota bacterium]
MTLADVNEMTQDTFVEKLGWIFEHSPWVAERAWSARPFESIGALHQAMTDQVTLAKLDERLALLRAHPDLGTRARISSASTQEQAGVGLDQLTPEEFDRLKRLNTTYREKFGFPFLFAVKGSNKHAILAALECRVVSDPEPELTEALRQVFRIAEFRLNDTLSAEGGN